MIIAGGILHLLVVALPLFCLGLVGTSIADPAVLIFLAGASSLYAGDAVTMQWWSSESRSPLNARAKRWATVMGGLLLLLFWACLVGVPGGRAWWACLVGVPGGTRGHSACRFVASSPRRCPASFRSRASCCSVPHARSQISHRDRSGRRCARAQRRLSLLAASLRNGFVGSVDRSGSSASKHHRFRRLVRCIAPGNARAFVTGRERPRASFRKSLRTLRRRSRRFATALIHYSPWTTSITQISPRLFCHPK